MDFSPGWIDFTSKDSRQFGIISWTQPIQLWCREINDPVTIKKQSFLGPGLFSGVSFRQDTSTTSTINYFNQLRQRPRIILEKLRSVAAELQPSRVVFVELRTAEPVMACVLVDFCWCLLCEWLPTRCYVVFLSKSCLPNEVRWRFFG